MVGALIEASLLHECRERAARALSGLNRLPRGAVDVLCEMRLHSAYAAASLHTSGDVNETEASWQRVLVLAHETGDTAFESRALWGMWNTMLTRADVHRSFRYATRFQQLAKRSESARQNLYAEAMVAVSLHCFGEHEQARDRLERIVATMDRAESPLSDCGGLAVDPFIFASGTLARIAWLQGRSAEAMQRVEECINRIKPEMLEPSLSHLLAVLAIPIVMLNGEFDTASRYLGLLRSQVALNRFDVWAVYGECLGGYLDIATGRREAGLVRMECAIRDLEARGFRRLLTPMIAVWAQACAEVGRVAPAQKKLGDALAACRDGGEQFFVPELLRTLGVASFEYARTVQECSDLAQHHEEQGRAHLREAIRMAREHDARMWELRATLDLARHLLDRQRVDEAASLIEQVVLRVDPNSNAPDVRRLVELRGLISRSLPQTRGDARETVRASVRR
jgi:tetratricopeptide (TPR) repeat protein